MWLGDVCSYHSRTEPEKVHNRGGIGMNPHTLMTVLEELCDEIHRNGFRKILVVNNHGGNTGFLSYFSRGLGYSGKEYAFLYTSATGTVTRAENAYNAITARRDEFPMITERDLEVLQSYIPTGYGGGHGHFSEAALMMGLYPGLCRPDKFDAESGLSTHRADYLTAKEITFTVGWGANFPNAYNGFAPHGASESIGKAFAKLAAERLAGIFKLLKEDEDCVRMTQRLPKLD
jgi:creatinine amidohydrolase